MEAEAAVGSYLAGTGPREVRFRSSITLRSRSRSTSHRGRHRATPREVDHNGTVA